jgi:hypothetical protein
MLSIRIPTATAEGFTATVRRNATVNKASLRTLILNLAADALGCTMEQMRQKGYDVSYMKDGWEVDSAEEAGRYRTNTYRVRPLTAREQAAILRERGGFVDNGDGSMGFIMPSPRRKATPVQVRQQGQ